MLFRLLLWSTTILLLYSCEALLNPVESVQEAHQALKPVPVLSREERWDNNRMAGDYLRIAPLYGPPLDSLPTRLRPADCSYCWQHGRYGAAIDLEKAVKRIETHWVTHPEGYRGLEVRLVVPQRYASDCQSLVCSIPYSELTYGEGHQLKLWELGDRVVLNAETAPPTRNDLGFETLPAPQKGSPLFPLWSPIVEGVAESEAVFRFFFRAYSQKTDITAITGYLDLVVTQGGFVPVAQFGRQDVGTTQRSAYGSITLLGFEDNHVQFHLEKQNDWQVFRVLGTDENGQILGLSAAQIEAHSEQGFNEHTTYQSVHRRQHRFFSDSPTASLELYQAFMRPFYERFTFQPELAIQHLGPLTLQKRLLYASPTVSFYAVPRSNNMRRTLSVKKF